MAVAAATRFAAWLVPGIHDEETGLRSILSLARSHCPISAYELYEHLGFSVFISRHLHALALAMHPEKPARPQAPPCHGGNSKY